MRARTDSLDLESELLKMRSSLAHRGPDDQGIWLAPNGRVGLVHTRLAIIDLSPSGHQPMLSVDGKYVVVFNGEIYNYRELRSQLEGEGIIFRTQSDTEVLIALYQRHGRDMVHRLRGMFAFGIWDDEKQSCFLARDPLGVKPLYYAEDSGRLAFASEMRTLISAGFTTRRINPSALFSYFLKGSVPEPMTLCEGLHQLEAGHHLTWENGATRREQYWKPHFSWRTDPVSSTDAAEYTRAALQSSVERHFVSDVPVGIFLSGGIDSTSVLALASHGGRRSIDTYSVGVDDPSMDESAPAAKIAAHFNASHHSMRLDGGKARDLFEKFLEYQDQPSIDGLNTFAASSLAHEFGLKVVISGLGGDELFGGYPSFQLVPRMLQVSSLLGPCAPPLGRLLQSKNVPGKWQRLGAFLAGERTTWDAYHALRSIFTYVQARRLVGRLLPDVDASQLAAPRVAFDDDFALADQISLLETTRYMRNQLLRDSDAMSMACALELRVPLVDQTLIDAMSSVPPEIRLQKGKKLLVQAIPEIPDWVANAPKRGFQFPFRKWIESSWGDTMAASDALLESDEVSWYQRWSVAVFMAWKSRMGMN